MYFHSLSVTFHSGWNRSRSFSHTFQSSLCQTLVSGEIRFYLPRPIASLSNKYRDAVLSVLSEWKILLFDFELFLISTWNDNGRFRRRRKKPDVFRWSASKMKQRRKIWRDDRCDDRNLREVVESLTNTVTLAFSEHGSYLLWIKKKPDSAHHRLWSAMIQDTLIQGEQA